MIDTETKKGIRFNLDGRFLHRVVCSRCSTVLLETHGSIWLNKDVGVAFTCPDPECATKTIWTDLPSGIGPSHNQFTDLLKMLTDPAGRG